MFNLLIQARSQTVRFPEALPRTSLLERLENAFFAFIRNFCATPAPILQTARTRVDRLTRAWEQQRLRLR